MDLRHCLCLHKIAAQSYVTGIPENVIQVIMFLEDLLLDFAYFFVPLPCVDRSY